MRVLVVGEGGREHALCWKLSQSSKISALFCAPGNGGTLRYGENLPLQGGCVDSVLAAVKEKAIDLVVIGPEAPLEKGLSDVLRAEGVKVFAPSMSAAALEYSKAYAKNFMFKYNIPTAAWAEFDDFHQARDYIASQKTPLVIKADGLAAGKGVIIAPDKEAAINAARDMLVENAFGSAGHKILVEEFLSGEEISVMAFCDGEHIVPMVSAQDHKRAFDNDMGPNTGGMGAYSPSPLYDEVLERRIMEEILVPTCVKMKEEGRPYKGVLYAGLMITESGPKVLEYNARFGDPETQVVLARLKSDLMDIIAAVNEGGIHKINIEWRHEAAACVVMASGGYPGEYEKGYEIKGINKAENKDVLVFHSGTVARNNKIFSNGGRVLGITALGAGIREAVDHAYEAVREIDFTAAFYRKDIGAKALREC